MKKLLALLLVSVMCLSLVACGDKEPVEDDSTGGMIALCSDVGSIDDESFNQACWEGIQEYASENGLESQYYIPTEDNTEQRETILRQAVSDGAEIIVCTGYMYGQSLAWAAEEYPQVKLIAIDVSEADVTAYADKVADNIYCVTFKEEQAGYLAGYAAVKEGFTKLGFLGGISVPAVVRYGYGFIQGADDAAGETGTPVEINYTYGGQFFADANITAKMEGWYSKGTEVVFSCGGGIYSSAVEAALQNKGYVIGVDVDQNYVGVNGVEDGSYAYNPFITSAMKSLKSSVITALATFYDGQWDTIGGTCGLLGIEEGGYVGLPTDETSWNMDKFTVEQYEEVVVAIKNGDVKISNSFDVKAKPEVKNIKVNYID